MAVRLAAAVASGLLVCGAHGLTTTTAPAALRTEALDMYHIEERPVDEGEVRRVVERHLWDRGKWLGSRRAHEHTRLAVEALKRGAFAGDRRVLVDAGCGAMRSTAALAAAYPDRSVVGIDRSEARLGKSTVLPANAVTVRADLGDFWRLAAEDELVRSRVHHTFCFYPNPYPKTAHLKRRWHGHPCFASMLDAAGSGLTLRASWRTYLDEFNLAVEVAAHAGHPAAQALLAGQGNDQTEPVLLDPPAPGDAMTHFEAKYAAAGIPVYELRLGEAPSAREEPR